MNKLHFFIVLSLSTFFVTTTKGNAQQIESNICLIQNKEHLDLKMDSILLDKYYENAEQEIKVVFFLKVDSLGEIHSAHIRLSKNLKTDEYYSICSMVEEKLNVKFLYDEYKKDYIGDGRYIICVYPYFSNR